MAYMKTGLEGLAYDDGGRHDTFMRQQLSLSVDEHMASRAFYPICKKRQSIDIWNADGEHQPNSHIKIFLLYFGQRLWSPL